MTETDVLGGVASVLSVVAFLPQVVKAWRSGSTADISLVTFILIASGAGVWMVYAHLRQDWAVMTTNACILVLALAVLGLKFLHGNSRIVTDTSRSGID